jgi:hypothetical protein
MTPDEMDVVHDAIDEVLMAYSDSGYTFDGVLDVGDSLQSLGALVGRDLRQEAIEAYDEENGPDDGEEDDDD